jgi:hypothetical protein
MRVRLTVLALFVTLAAGDAAAQRTSTHKGATMAFAVGRGTLRVNCEGCRDGRRADMSAMARFGWTVTEDLFVAAEVMGFEHATYVDLETISVSSYWAGAVALWYPRPYSEAYFKGGVGFSASNGPFPVANVGSVDITLNRPGFLVGVGADLRMGRSFSVTPFIDFILIAPGEQAVPGRPTPLKVGGNVLNVGIALVQH